MALTRAVASRMVERGKGGAIVFITSIHQHVPHGKPAYSATKAALGMIVQELSLELAPHGIRVNGIAPGWVAENAQGFPIRYSRAPLHQESVHPRYIGRGVVYLAADYFSRCITGTVITIDSGLSQWRNEP